MEMSSTKKVLFDHSVSSNTSRGKRRLSKSERTRKSRELFCRKGSRILPDFFPPDASTTKTVNDENILPVKSKSIKKQYSWEKDENGESEAQMIAESWMIYFGLESCNTCFLETECKVTEWMNACNLSSRTSILNFVLNAIKEMVD